MKRQCGMLKVYIRKSNFFSKLEQSFVYVSFIFFPKLDMDFYNLSRVYCCSKKRIVNKKKGLDNREETRGVCQPCLPHSKRKGDQSLNLIPILPASSINFSSEYRTEQIKESDSDS